MAQSFVHEEIVINAPLSAVWALMGCFEDMSPWFPSAAECSADRVGVGAVGNQGDISSKHPISAHTADRGALITISS